MLSFALKCRECLETVGETIDVLAFYFSKLQDKWGAPSLRGDKCTTCKVPPPPPPFKTQWPGSFKRMEGNKAFWFLGKLNTQISRFSGVRSKACFQHVTWHDNASTLKLTNTFFKENSGSQPAHRDTVGWHEALAGLSCRGHPLPSRKTGASLQTVAERKP